MTELRIEKLTIPSSDPGMLSSLPPISEKLCLGDIENKFCLDEDDGLYINYGNVDCAYPYRYLDMYTRELKDKEYDSFVLENDFIKAVFMPDFGGKLWSLQDKTTGRELLFKNDVVRPCNLSVRNAWMSGGIEWNCGYKGHHAYTCSLISTAKTQLEDGTPVVRFYLYERIRCAVVQMDFFLPDGYRFLCCRMRITNPNSYVVPMYWWSNVAVEEKTGDRVVVPADMSYTAPNGYVEKINIPVFNGIDVTYPENNVIANDFFWTTYKDKRKYIYQADKDGYGLFQTSTSRLKGRKLFVWGNSQGGKKWQNFLTGDDKSGRYNEIQSGLANTQHECLPMPPHTVWEWLECYGSMQTDSAKIHNTWESARAETEAVLESIITEADVEKLLDDTRSMAKSPAKELVYQGEGWAALELMRRQLYGSDLMCNHLDFGKIGVEQQDWANLLKNGTIGEHSPEDVPLSYMRQAEWTALLENAVENKDKDNWYAYYLLGTTAIADGEYKKGNAYLERSVELQENVWSYYALAVSFEKCGDTAKSAQYMIKAHSMRKGDISLAKDVYRSLNGAKMYDSVIELFESDTDNVRENERCLLYYANALARTGKIEESENILYKDGKYLVVPDIRECELTITDLWIYICNQKGVEVNVPYDLDFRMTENKDEWLG